MDTWQYHRDQVVVMRDPILVHRRICDSVRQAIRVTLQSVLCATADDLFAELAPLAARRGVDMDTVLDPSGAVLNVRQLLTPRSRVSLLVVCKCGYPSVAGRGEHCSLAGCHSDGTVKRPIKCLR